MIRAIPDDEGWVHTLITQEVPDGVEVPVPAGEVVLPRWPPVELPFLRVGGAGSLYTPHDDRAAWRRLRQLGLSGPEACGLARQRSLGRLPDSEIHVVLPPSGRGITHDFPDVPGLRLRPLEADDLDVMAPSAIEAGTHLARCPGDPPCCRPPEAHAWLRLAERIDRDDTWQQTLEFNGQPLQMELILVTGDQALFSYTTHFTRERPHWFWREAERPVFEAMRRAGVRTVLSRTRADRPDWIQSLKDSYGAVDDGVWDRHTVRLRFDPDTALSKMGGWPQRKTGGPGWSWEQGGIRVWEGTEADFPAVDGLVEQIGSATQRAFVRDRWRQWWDLDRATLLLSSLNGTLTTARLVRPRRAGASGLFAVSPLTSDRLTQHRTVIEGVKAWHRQVGYAKITYLTPEVVLRTGGRATLEAVGAREIAQHTKFRTPLTEWEIDV